MQAPMGPPPGLVNGFPQSFDVFAQNRMVKPEYVLGPSKEAPLYLATLRPGQGKLVVLHAGPHKQLPELASASVAKDLSSQCTVYINGQPVTQKLKDKSGMGSSYTFSITVFTVGAPPGTCHEEQFTWRKSKGGLELVVTSSAAAKEFSFREAMLGVGASSKGGEVLAVWTRHKSLLETSGKKGTFEFCGRGATGELGPAWTQMAVITGLRIVQVKEEMRMVKAVLHGVGS